MFKASIQRQAQLGHVARRQFSSRTVAALRSSNLCRPASAISGQPTLRTALRPISLVRNVIPRFYASEAAAAQEQDPSSDATSGLITRFADLTKLDVDKNLVAALVQGMGYEKMTEVQSLTINPAMKGIDL